MYVLYACNTCAFNGPSSGTTWVSRYQRGKTNLDFTEATDSEWQWHQLGHMQFCMSLQTDNHATIPPLSFYRLDAFPAAQPTASKALKAIRMLLSECLVLVVTFVVQSSSGDDSASTFESSVCKVCMDAVIDCLLLECGHMVTCTACGKRLAECPICRRYVVRVVRVFRA